MTYQEEVRRQARGYTANSTYMTPLGRHAEVRPRPRAAADPRGDYELEFKKFEKCILRIMAALALLGGVAGWAYGALSGGAAVPAWALAGAGAIAGGAGLPALLWALMVVAGIVEATVGLLNELARVVPRLVLACALVYAAYRFCQTLV